MKKKRILSIIMLAFILTGMIGISTMAEGVGFEEKKDVISQWGNYLSSKFYDADKTSRSSDDSEMEQAITFYELQGYDHKQAQSLAEEYVKESNAIYKKALTEGYSVTEEEVSSYVEWLKDMYHNDPELNEDSKKQMEVMINSFKNEEDYWEYLRGVYQKSLASQNYVEDLQNNYFAMNPEASYADWETYFEDWKKALVAEN